MDCISSSVTSNWVALKLLQNPVYCVTHIFPPNHKVEYLPTNSFWNTFQLISSSNEVLLLGTICGQSKGTYVWLTRSCSLPICGGIPSNVKLLSATCFMINNITGMPVTYRSEIVFLILCICKFESMSKSTHIIEIQ